MGKNLEIMKKFLARFQSGDWEGACENYVAEDFECHEPPGLPQEGVFRGRDASMQVSHIYRDIWDVSIDDQQYWEAEDDDIVFSRYVITWTSKKTGKSVTQPISEMNYFKDGKIAKMEVFHFNPIGLVETLSK